MSNRRRTPSRHLSVSAARPITEQLESRQLLSVSAPLTGTVIGTAGSYHNDGNTISKVFDGNLGNFFDGPTANGNYAGLDLGTGKLITSISYAPRVGYGQRMIGGVFQGSDSADFSGPVTTLYKITASPASSTFTTVNVSSATPFRYVRYLSPDGSYGDVGEVQFSGNAPASGATLTNGLLTVYGTGSADNIMLELNDDSGVTVTLNGSQTNFAYSAVQQVVVASLGGNDMIEEDVENVDDAALPVVQIAAGDGDDLVSADTGEFNNVSAPMIDGGGGNDTISADGDGQMSLYGGDGNDLIDVVGVDDAYASMFGNEGNDTLRAHDYADVAMDGGAGDDLLDGSDEYWSSSYVGGAGNDTLDLSSQEFSGSVVLNMDGKNDSTSNVEIGTDIENLNYNDGLTDGPITINGNVAGSAITVSESDNATINAGSGSSVLTFEHATGTLNGGSGNDTLYSHNSSESGDLVINGGGGNNVIYADGDGLENATINGGTGNDTITTVNGDDLDIIGGSGSNVISVGDGESTSEPNIDGDPDLVSITGGAGGDTITGSAYAATIVGGSGTDSINFDGRESLDIEAGNGNNTITAASGKLLVNGGSGSDTITDDSQAVFEGDFSSSPTATLNGGAGNDTIYANKPDGQYGFYDLIDGGANTDTAYIDPAFDTVTNVENVIDYAGSGGNVSGTVYRRQSFETVFLDANNNSVVDNGELTTTTDSNGAYTFTNVPAGVYVVRQVLPGRVHGKPRRPAITAIT